MSEKTLLDEFAMAAFPALLALLCDKSLSAGQLPMVAEAAYEAAAAMMKARPHQGDLTPC